MQLLTLFIPAFIWLVVLTALTLKTLVTLTNFSKGGGGNIIKALEELLTKSRENRKGLEEIKRELEVLSVDSRNHLQKVGLVKFNPFGEMGGSHSFALAMLDAHNNGVVITGLHARDKTRLYLKSIVAGKSELELSGEERNALSRAVGGKKIKDE